VSILLASYFFGTVWLFASWSCQFGTLVICQMCYTISYAHSINFFYSGAKLEVIKYLGMLVSPCTLYVSNLFPLTRKMFLSIFASTLCSIEGKLYTMSIVGRTKLINYILYFPQVNLPLASINNYQLRLTKKEAPFSNMFAKIKRK
jgi:hypothetical protein